MLYKKAYDLDLGNPMDLSGNQVEDGGKVLLKLFLNGMTLGESGYPSSSSIRINIPVDMHNNRLANLPAPAAGNDYVDNAPFVKTDGSRMMAAPLNMNEQRVENMANPVNEQDSVNKRYLESQLVDYVKRNGTEPMTFNLDMANYRITNTGDPQGKKDAANKRYVDRFLQLTGGPMQGVLNMNNFNVTNLPLPTDIEEAANKQYVDDNLFEIRRHQPPVGRH